MATNPNKKALPGSERPPVPGSTQIGALEPGERVRFTVLLRQRPGGPAPHELDHWQNVPPAKRRHLSTEEYFQSYGGSDEDLAAVVDFLTDAHLHVISADAGRRHIDVEGTAAEINAAFDITLNRYRVHQRIVTRRIERHGERPTEVTIPEHTHRGFEGPVHVPARLVGVIAAVIGLDNRRLGAPAGTGTGDPPGAQYLSPVTISQLYNFPTFSAAGQTVGIYEAADQLAAYLASDITAYLASLPAGYNTAPNLTDIGLLGHTNNTALVTDGPPFSGRVIEATLDVAVVAAMAQGANINVYFTEDTENGWVAFFNRALFPLPGENPPSVLTASWGPNLQRRYQHDRRSHCRRHSFEHAHRLSAGRGPARHHCVHGCRRLGVRQSDCRHALSSQLSQLGSWGHFLRRHHYRQHQCVHAGYIRRVHLERRQHRISVPEWRL